MSGQGRLDVRTPGFSDGRAFGRPDVQASGRPDAWTPGRLSPPLFSISKKRLVEKNPHEPSQKKDSRYPFFFVSTVSSYPHHIFSLFPFRVISFLSVSIFLIFREGDGELHPVKA